MRNFNFSLFSYSARGSIAKYEAETPSGSGSITLDKTAQAKQILESLQAEGSLSFSDIGKKKEQLKVLL